MYQRDRDMTLELAKSGMVEHKNRLKVVWLNLELTKSGMVEL